MTTIDDFRLRLLLSAWYRTYTTLMGLRIQKYLCLAREWHKISKYRTLLSTSNNMSVDKNAPFGWLNRVRIKIHRESRTSMMGTVVWKVKSDKG